MQDDLAKITILIKAGTADSRYISENTDVHSFGIVSSLECRISKLCATALEASRLCVLTASAIVVAWTWKQNVEMIDLDAQQRCEVPGRSLVFTGTGSTESLTNDIFVAISASDFLFVSGFSGAARTSLRQLVESHLGARYVEHSV